jgi:hypothetical protein
VRVDASEQRLEALLRDLKDAFAANGAGGGSPGQLLAELAGNSLAEVGGGGGARLCVGTLDQFLPRGGGGPWRCWEVFTARAFTQRANSLSSAKARSDSFVFTYSRLQNGTTNLHNQTCEVT